MIVDVDVDVDVPFHSLTLPSLPSYRVPNQEALPLEKPRSPLAAVLLSLACPGLGHLYCGRLLPAVLFWAGSFAGWAFFLLAWGLGTMELSAGYGGFLAANAAVWCAAAVTAGLAARKSPKGYQLRAYNLWYFYLLVWLLGFAVPNGALVQLTRSRLLRTLPLASDFMRPTLLPGDAVMVDQRGAVIASLERGAVVAIEDPADPEIVRILRLAAFENEKVELASGALTVAGTPAPHRVDSETTYPQKAPRGDFEPEPVLLATETLGGIAHAIYLHPDEAGRQSGAWTPGPGEVFLLGDNRKHAVDSTTFGPVPRASILGKVIAIRFSRDPRTGQWRPQRRRMPVR